jgi:hypothetical protein
MLHICARKNCVCAPPIVFPLSNRYFNTAEAEKWLQDHLEPIPIKQRLQIPVLCLRWAQSCINRNMMFGHHGQDDESIFKLVDELQRGVKAPVDIEQVLDVVQYQGHLFSLYNPNRKERPATLNQTVMHICCKRSCKKKEQGVLVAKQIYAINTSSSMVLPKLREGSVDPPGNICVYIQLLGIYNYKLTAPSFLLQFLG